MKEAFCQQVLCQDMHLHLAHVAIVVLAFWLREAMRVHELALNNRKTSSTIQAVIVQHSPLTRHGSNLVVEAERSCNSVSEARAEAETQFVRAGTSNVAACTS